MINVLSGSNYWADSHRFNIHSFRYEKDLHSGQIYYLIYPFVNAAAYGLMVAYGFYGGSPELRDLFDSFINPVPDMPEYIHINRGIVT